MKKLIACYLLVVHIACFGQSNNWEQLGAMQNNYYKVVFQSSQGNLIAEESNDRNLFYSRDHGKNWLEIEFKIDINFDPRSDVRHFREKDNKIYFSVHDTIYEFDDVNLKMNTFFTTSQPSIILGFSFLKTKDFLVIENNCIVLYTKQKKIKKRFCLFPQELICLTGENKNYIIYTIDGSQNSIITFTDNLDVESERSIGLGAFYQTPITSGNRIFFYWGSTDDGALTYNNYKLEGKEIIFENLRKASDGIYAFKGNNIYKSIDNGSNFKHYKSVAALKIRALFSENGNFLTAQANDCTDNYAIFSINTNDSSCLISNADFGRPQAKWVMPAFDEHIYSNDCSNHYSIYNPSLKDWTSENVDASFKKAAGFLNLQNGSTLCINYSMPNFIRTSNDTGWEPLPIDTLGFAFDTFGYYDNYFTAFEKESGIFIRDYDTLFTSQNNGQTWNGTLFSNIVKLTASNSQIDFSVVNKDLIYFGDYYNDLFYKVNLKTKDYKVIYNHSSIIVEHETSFDGKTLYLLQYDNVKYSLQVSNDFGETFTFIDLNIPYLPNYYYKLYTDHLGHLFIVSKFHVFISNDKGKSLEEITPLDPNLFRINEVKVSYDNYLYLATDGLGVVKNKSQLNRIIAVDEVKSKYLLAIYPNPATEILKWSLSANADSEFNIIDIFDLSGKVILHNITSNNEINTNEINEGSYILQIKNNQQVYRALFMKI